MAPVTRSKLSKSLEVVEQKEEYEAGGRDDGEGEGEDAEEEEEEEEEDEEEEESSKGRGYSWEEYKKRIKNSMEECKEYLRQMYESDGYDIDLENMTYPKNHLKTYTAVPLRVLEEKRSLLKELCESAIQFYNQTNNKNKRRSRCRRSHDYKFHSLAYASWDFSFAYDYLLTFLAYPKQHDDDDDDSDNNSSPSCLVPFQAKVLYRTIGSRLVKVYSCNIKAPPVVKNVQVVGDAVEGNTIKGVGHYVGGRQGPSTFEWFRLNTHTRKRVLVSRGSLEYTITAKDVDQRLLFKYTPVDSVGQKGKPRWKSSQIVEIGIDRSGAGKLKTEVEIVNDRVCEC